MDAEQIKEIAERDQLWASLRALAPEILKLAEEPLGNTEREQQLVRVLARIVASELDFRDRMNGPGAV